MKNGVGLQVIIGDKENVSNTSLSINGEGMEESTYIRTYM